MKNQLVNKPIKLSVAICGDTAVGKSCLLLRYIDDRFQPVQDLTIGVEFGSKTFKLNNTFKVNVWDMAGTTLEYIDTSKSYLLNQHGYIVCYDVTARNTFDHLPRWFKAIQDVNSGRKLCLCIVGNKVDKRNRVVTTEEGLAFAEGVGAEFFEVSALMPEIASHQPKDIFEFIARQYENGAISIDHSSEHNAMLQITGARSFFNSHKINGIYAIVQMQPKCSADKSGVGDAGISKYVFTNIDSPLSTLQWDGLTSSWTIHKGDKILAKVHNQKPWDTDASGSVECQWIENWGIFVNWFFNQPQLQCQFYEPESRKARRASIFRSMSAVTSSVESRQVEADMNAEEIVVDMQQFLQYSKEPQRLGLTIPLFVRYCSLHSDVLRLEFEHHKTSLDFNAMESIRTRLVEIESACSSLLASMAITSFRMSITGSSSLVSRSKEELVQKLIDYRVELKDHFDNMCDIQNGNFEVARQCLKTIREWDELIERLQKMDGRDTSEKVKSDSRSTISNNEKASPASDICLQDIAINEDSAQLETVTDVIQGSLDEDNLSIQRVLQGKGIKERSRCDMLSTRWIMIEEIENCTNGEIESKCIVTSGLQTTSSVDISIALEAALQVAGGIGGSIGMQWSKTIEKQTVREQNLRIPSMTKLIVEQEVLEGILYVKKKGLIEVLSTKKEKKFPFCIRKDSIRYKTEAVSG